MGRIAAHPAPQSLALQGSLTLWKSMTQRRQPQVKDLPSRFLDFSHQQIIGETSRWGLPTVRQVTSLPYSLTLSLSSLVAANDPELMLPIYLPSSKVFWVIEQ